MFRIKLRVLATAAAISLCGLATAVAQAPPAARGRANTEAANSKLWNANPAPSDPRDFQGMWWGEGVTQAGGGGAVWHAVTAAQLSKKDQDAFIPLTALGRSIRDHNLAMLASGQPQENTATNCREHGMPRMMILGYPLKIDYAPGLIVMMVEVNHIMRYIHMDGKPAPADEPATPAGYSVGHWDGDTLIVDTDHLSGKTILDDNGGLNHGPKMTLHEEFTKFTNIYGGVDLRDLITITDPDYFTRPFTAERLLAWRGDSDFIEYVCEENNRNQAVNGLVTVK